MLQWDGTISYFEGAQNVYAYAYSRFGGKYTLGCDIYRNPEHIPTYVLEYSDDPYGFDDDLGGEYVEIYASNSVTDCMAYAEEYEVMKKLEMA